MVGEPASERVTVEFRVDDERYPFVGASKLESCTFELEEMIPRGDGVYSEFFRVQGADTDRILAVAEDTPKVEPTLLEEDGDEALFEFVVADGCIAVSIAEADAHPQVVRGDDGDGTVVADFPAEDARTLVRNLLDDHTGVTVVSEDDAAEALRDADPSERRRRLHETVHDVLSMRERGAVLTALSEGFYDWPRRTTLEELADSLGVDEDALDARLHNSEQKILAALFEDGALGASDDPVHPLSDAPPRATR